MFTWLIQTVGSFSIDPLVGHAQPNVRVLLCVVPAAGLLLVAWLTRRFAPEAQGHGVPEVIVAVARRDGIIRPRVSIVKILASALCIGTGGSVGREGPIVQIGSSLGSAAGQLLKLSAPNIKVLVACGTAAGISATFNAPLAGAIFASEIILGSFAVQEHSGEHGQNPVFSQLSYEYLGAVGQLPLYFIVRVARRNPSLESLPVVDEQEQLLGIIRPEDVRRVLDSEIPPQLLRATDVAMDAPISLSPDENLLETLRDFGTRDVESLPVECGTGKSRKLMGLLLRADVMRRYRRELLGTGSNRS